MIRGTRVALRHQDPAPVGTVVKMDRDEEHVWVRWHHTGDRVTREYTGDLIWLDAE